MTLGYDNEQRGFIRMSMDCSAKYRLKENTDWIDAIAKDLSAIGVQLQVDEELPLGSMLDIIVHPAQAVVVPLQADGEVVRVDKNENGYCIGLKLSNIK